MSRLVLIALLLLTACAPTRESCENRVTREIRKLDALIVEGRRDLERGYRYEVEPRNSGLGLTFCSASNRVRLCTGSRDHYVRRPVAIDPEAEHRKLDLLEARRMRLARQGAEECARRYAGS